MTAIEFLNHHRPIKLRVEDFLMLNDSGALEDYGKTELLDGEIVYMNAQHRPHARVKMALTRELIGALEDICSPLAVLSEVTMSAPPHDAPEPDIVVTSEPDGEGPVPLASVHLIVEVADATLRIDTGRKAKIYASHGIAEYWVADVGGRVVRQMWSPGPDGYGEARSIAFGADINSVSIPNLTISTTELDL